MIRYTAFVLIILLSLTGCQQSPKQQEELPTVMVLPSPTPLSTMTPIASPTMSLPPPSATFTITPSPQPPTLTSAPILIPTLALTPTPLNLPELFTFGRSIEGRDLVARRIGMGGQVILLVGGIHGGWESNTTTLIEEMIIHFEITPSDLLPGITLLFVPSLNPDGAVRGRVLAGRFNANSVDLNRNWACGWESTAVFQDQFVNPGTQPFSEPESLALAALINDLRPATVLFYHSAANGVFGGGCNGNNVSDAMVQVLGEATGYPYGGEFTAYTVTGTAPAWVDSLGIPSADVELATSNATELDRNVRGVVALQCWLLSANGLPGCN